MGMNDKVTVRLVVGGLALAFLLCIVGAIMLTLDGDPIPELLAGVLATTHTVTAPQGPAVDPVPPAE